MNMSIPTFVPIGVAASLLALAAPAQVTISKGVAPSGIARCMNNNDNSIALTPDGAMWVVLYEVDSAGGNGHLELRRSTDHGATWPGAFTLPNNTSHNNHHNNSGCIVAGRGGDELHVAWADQTAAPGYWSAMYQAFDTKNLTWVGTPTLLAKGYGSTNSFWPVDIDVTPKGTVVVCVSGNSGGGLGLGSWDCGLAVKEIGGTFNTTLINLRNGGASYSQNAGIVAVDERIHCCMKNNTGAYGICYRSYDTEAKQWDQTTQVYIAPNNNSGIAAGNKSVIAADSAGGIYITYCTGNATAARTLRLAYAPPGKGSLNTDWQDIFVIPNTQTIGQNYRGVAASASDYPQIQGGNTTYRNFSLASDGGDTMTVVYSKPFEDFTHLYAQSFKAGVNVLPELKLSAATAAPYSHEWILGMRCGDYSYSPCWLTYGATNAPAPNTGTFPNGQVDFWRLGTVVARTVALGTGCQGKLTERPRVQAHESLPVIGTTFKLTMDRFPASATFFLAAGTQMFLPPLNLAFMGAKECELNQDFPVIAGFQASAAGTLVLPWAIPNSSQMIGIRAYAQCLVVAPGATNGNVVTTNSLCIVVGN